MTAETRRLSEAPDETLLTRLRALEMKMGLVLTLVRAETRLPRGACADCLWLQFKASVWAVINEQEVVGEASGYPDQTADDTIMQ